MAQRITDYSAGEIRIAIDREKIRRGGLAEFMRRAWPMVEPSAALIWNWHLDAMAEYLEACSSGEIRNLLICVPPGCTKSLTVSTLWPAWDWITHPGRRFVTATYAQELSNKNAKLHRDLVASEWYAERWGASATITRDTTAQVKNFENTLGGSRVSTAVGAGVTGRHGHVLLFDDLVKAQDAEGRAALDPKAIRAANEFWFRTMSTRQADPTKTIRVGIMQRLHYEDTAAACIDSGDYEVLCLPMRYDPDHPQVWARDPRKEGALLWPERFPEEEVAHLEKTLGPTAAAAQLGQTPAPAGGAMIKRDHLSHTFREVPSSARYIVAVDCAFKDTAGSDRVAIQVWAKAQTPAGWRFYLVDSVVDRMDVIATMDAIRRTAAKWPQATAIHIEDRANGTAVITMLKRDLPGVRPWPPKGTKFPGKVERVNAVLALYENGEVLLPEAAPWVSDYAEELTRFPVGKNDDQVDASTLALLVLRGSNTDRYRKAFGKKGSR